MEYKLLRIIAILYLAIHANLLHSQVPSYVPTNGLVGWWPFDGNANDLSGNGNNGTPINGVALTTDRFGNPNCSYNFDGLNDYIDVPDNTLLDLTGSFTISTWFSANNLGVINMILSKHDANLGSNAGTYSMGIWQVSNNYLINFQATPNFTPSTYPGVSGAVQSNSWRNFTVTYSITSGIMSYYLDGLIVFTSAFPFIIQNTTLSLKIGTNLNDNSLTNLFSGKLDDIGIWNRALTQAEITGIYNSTPILPTLSIAATPSTAVCSGTPVLLTASTTSSGATYSWSPGGATTPSITVSPTSTTTYSCTVTANSLSTTSSTIVTVLPAPTISIPPISSQSICVGGSVSALTIAVSGGTGTHTYQWYTLNGSTPTPITGATNSSYTPPVFNTTGTFNYTVIVSQAANGCNTTSPNAEIIVVASPLISSQPQANQSTCLGGTLNALNVTYFGGIGTPSYQWYSNTVNSYSGGTIIVGATSPSYLPQSTSAGTVYYYCVISFFTGSCQSISSGIATVTVLPSPQINPINDLTFCAGTPTIAINFTGTPGATYSWTNNNTSIGLASSGNGNIPSFIAQNNSPITTVAMIVVTPSITTGNQTCLGAPEIFTITVIPIPLVAPTQDQIVCCQSSPSLTIYVGNGSSYFWTATSNSSLLTGYPTSGNSIIPSFIPLNNDSITHQIDFVITPTITYNNLTCLGQQEIVTIFVLPCLTVDPVPNIERCSGEHLNEVVFSGNANSFNWTNTNMNNGIAQSGIGNIPDMILNNLSNTPINSQFDVSPYYVWQSTTCPGTATTFNLTIYPTPTVDAGNDISVCNSNSLTLSAIESLGSTVMWNGSLPNGSLIYPTQSGFQTVEATYPNGCTASDSIFVNILEPSSSSITQTACDQITINGDVFLQSGTYTQVIPNVAGCDSTITLNLTLDYSPTSPIVYVQNETQLSTDFIQDLSYQWIYCSDLNPISGQTSSNFNPNLNGIYAVVVTNGCGSDTSLCTSITTIGLDEHLSSQILLYPNPNNGVFTLEMPQALIGQTIQIFDMAGRLIQENTAQELKQHIELNDVATGSYWLRIGSETPMKLVKN